MAFNVVFYNFSKKSNSTARPTGGTTFSCNLKSDSSVVNPRIELNYDGNPSGFNYAYIAHYGRYYYITDWTYTPGIWTATMQTDVLATYKTEIGSESLYVLRSSAAYDGNILDTMYPPKLPVTGVRSVTDIPDWSKSDGGTYIVGIAATNAPQMGAVTYFVTGQAGLMNLISYMYGAAMSNADSELQQDVNDIMVGALTPEYGLAMSEARVSAYQARYNFNPLQYIVSCMYVPFSAPQGTAQNVTMGFLDTQISLIRLSSPIWTRTATVSLPRHPQAASRGNYLNQSPYTRYVLNTTLFGDIELNTAEIGNDDSISCTVVVDCVSGAGYLYVRTGGTLSGSRFLASRSAQVGCDIALAQNLIDKTGSAATFAQQRGGQIMRGLGAVGSALMGNIAGAVSGVGNMLVSEVSAIDSIMKADTPRLSLSGSNAGIAVTAGTDFTLYAEFYDLPPEDNANRGRPLMQMRTPASLGGYMMISDGAVPIPGTAGEQAELKSILEAGFYYE